MKLNVSTASAIALALLFSILIICYTEEETIKNILIQKVLKLSSYLSYYFVFYWFLRDTRQQIINIYRGMDDI